MSLFLLFFYGILYIIQKEVFIMNYFISIFTGIVLAIMISLNGGLGNISGNYASSVIIHFVGLIGIIFVLIFTKSKIKNLKGIPFYMFTGGLIGILTVLFTNIGFMGLGVSLTVSLSLLGQLVTSLVIDHFGYFNMTVVEFDKKKILGLIVIIAGIYVMTLS
jgi:transporter family-2 protein